MMAPKQGLARAHVHVPAGIASHGIVPAAVDPELGHPLGTLHGDLEGVDIFVGSGGLEEGQDGGGVVVAVQDVVGEIATEAARVVDERVRGVVGRGVVDDGEAGGAEVDGDVGKGAGGDAATARAVGEDFFCLAKLSARYVWHEFCFSRWVKSYNTRC